MMKKMRRIVYDVMTIGKCLIVMMIDEEYALRR